MSVCETSRFASESTTYVRVRLDNDEGLGVQAVRASEAIKMGPRHFSF